MGWKGERDARVSHFFIIIIMAADQKQQQPRLDLYIPEEDAFVQKPVDAVGFVPAQLLAPTRPDTEKLAMMRCIPVSSPIATNSPVHLPRDEVAPEVWAATLKHYEPILSGNSDAFYRTVILGLPRQTGGGGGGGGDNEKPMLWTDTINNIMPLLTRCEEMAQRIREHQPMPDKKGVRLSAEKVMVVAFSAFMAVYLQYWGIVNNRFMVYRPAKISKAEPYAVRYPEVLLMLFPKVDFERTYFKDTKAAARRAQKREKKQEGARKINVDLPVYLSADSAKYEGASLIDMTAAVPFLDALVLVATYFLKWRRETLDAFLAFVDNDCRNWKLCLTSRGFNFFPFQDIQALLSGSVSSTSSSSSSSSSTTKLGGKKRGGGGGGGKDVDQPSPPVAELVRHGNWFPQSHYVTYRYKMSPALNIDEGKVPILAAHTRLSAFSPVIDLSVAPQRAEDGEDEKSDVLGALSVCAVQTCFFLPADHEKALHRIACISDTAIERVMFRCCDPLRIRASFILARTEQHKPTTLLFTPPLCTRLHDYPLSERTPASVTPSMLTYANDVFDMRGMLRWCVPSVESLAHCDSTISPYIKVVYEQKTKTLVDRKSATATTTTMTTAPPRDRITARLVGSFANLKPGQLRANEVLKFYRAMLVVTGGEMLPACALLVHYADASYKREHSHHAALAQDLRRQYYDYFDDLANIEYHINTSWAKLSKSRAVPRYYTHFIELERGWDKLSVPERADFSLDAFRSAIVDETLVRTLLDLHTGGGPNAMTKDVETQLVRCLMQGAATCDGGGGGVSEQLLESLRCEFEDFIIDPLREWFWCWFQPTLIQWKYGTQVRRFVDTIDSVVSQFQTKIRQMRISQSFQKFADSLVPSHRQVISTLLGHSSSFSSPQSIAPPVAPPVVPAALTTRDMAIRLLVSHMTLMRTVSDEVLGTVVREMATDPAYSPFEVARDLYDFVEAALQKLSEQKSSAPIAEACRKHLFETRTTAECLRKVIADEHDRRLAAMAADLNSSPPPQMQPLPLLPSAPVPVSVPKRKRARTPGKSSASSSSSESESVPKRRRQLSSEEIEALLLETIPVVD